MYHLLLAATLQATQAVEMLASPPDSSAGLKRVVRHINAGHCEVNSGGMANGEAAAVQHAHGPLQVLPATAHPLQALPRILQPMATLMA